MAKRSICSIVISLVALPARPSCSGAAGLGGDVEFGLMKRNDGLSSRNSESPDEMTV